MNAFDERLRGLNVKPMFYYEEGTTTVCLLLRPDGTVVSRGVAICSPLDQFARRIGRTKAMGMAVAAVENKKNSRKIREFGHPSMVRAHFTFGYRSSYLPDLEWRNSALTEKEVALLKRVRS